MTVEELIKVLKTFPKDYPVHYRLCDGDVHYFNIDVYCRSDIKTVVISNHDQVC